MSGMKLPRLTLLLAIYVSFDLSSPLMPGALRFSVQDSVEARRTDTFRISTATSALPLAPVPKPLALVEPGTERNRPVVTVNPCFPRAHVTRSDPSLPSAPSPEDS
jgi:hypothetical protein